MKINQALFVNISGKTLLDKHNLCVIYNLATDRQAVAPNPLRDCKYASIDDKGAILCFHKNRPTDCKETSYQELTHLLETGGYDNIKINRGMA